ncbi:MAG TPA: NifB/NifX family molybdenum-iron cluster-binding protein [Smithella sp.]|jgi:predicted Fe-Mo cluster-binding NifX family protein|nr:NifB/NifX family molybdenum-iron cluster-binding protein [Smithella sp.]NMC97065.1 dinitrogenase iron-molybdenum cofactor biosynthesis protein [Deltaproteobacteria bacterium]OQC52490.1 MAG: Dinitrogenase iron-molybdenum cofactor [Deltaproteobacteria bacterium ADurb.Bin022]HOQ41553.1 NifB/NifX family molybdenum-iron cluster-binding protein [Smithellaceae bacterium]HOE32490.1 NifB/NifX family molybdenum-iron cluster-binding protein [Smithella sp.]
MKIALTTSGVDLNAPLDSRFGRAPKFLIYDQAANTFEIVDNEQNLNAAQGAGIQSAQNIARLGVKALITGHCGPKAFRTLQAAGIRIYNTSAATVSEALEQYREGTLTEAKSADVDGHWV